MVYLLEMKFQRMSTAKELIIMRLISIFPFLISILFAQVDYNSEIQPIFNSSCTGCHVYGHSSGLVLTSYTGVMNGGNSGGVIEPYNHSGSYLWERVDDGSMPPGNNPNLSQDEVDLIAQWIDEGALETPADPVNLFFSEYIEGSGNNKVLEIYNPTGTSVDFSDYTIQMS